MLLPLPARRYQYLNLMHFLHFGEEAPPGRGTRSAPSIANEKEWPSWMEFFKGEPFYINPLEAVRMTVTSLCSGGPVAQPAFWEESSGLRLAGKWLTGSARLGRRALQGLHTRQC